MKKKCTFKDFFIVATMLATIVSKLVSNVTVSASLMYQISLQSATELLFWNIKAQGDVPECLQGILINHRQ